MPAKIVQLVACPNPHVGGGQHYIALDANGNLWCGCLAKHGKHMIWYPMTQERAES